MATKVAPSKSRKVKDVELHAHARWNGKSDAFFGTHGLTVLKNFEQTCNNANISAKAKVQLLQSGQFHKNEAGNGTASDRLLQKLAECQQDYQAVVQLPKKIIPHPGAHVNAQKAVNEQAEVYFLDRVEEQYYEVLLKKMYRVFLKEVVPSTKFPASYDPYRC